MQSSENRPDNVGFKKPLFSLYISGQHGETNIDLSLLSILMKIEANISMPDLLLFKVYPLFFYYSGGLTGGDGYGS